MNEHCILWCGGFHSFGYGLLPGHRPQSGQRYAHRWAYEKFYGPIPEGLSVLHSCDVPACINPFHLRAGTQQENLRDMASRGRNVQQKKTQCPLGHPYLGSNVKMTQGRRRCRICLNAARRRRRRSRQRGA